MPTYEYECAKCKKNFEIFQSIKDQPLTKCPTCKGKVKRLLGTGAGIIFKGSGFYQTDYRSEGYKQKAKSESSSAPASAAASSETAKSAAKPAAPEKK